MIMFIKEKINNNDNNNNNNNNNNNSNNNNNCNRKPTSDKIKTTVWTRIMI